MKKWVDDEKSTGPMFPSLHVNDTERGGPRAPPRNKMALYEQLSIPSQRFNTARVPLSNNKARSSAPPASFSQGSDHERREFSPIPLPPLSRQADMHQTHNSEAISPSSPVAQHERSKVARDEDDFSVPISVHSEMGQGRRKNQSSTDRGKLTPLSASYTGPSAKNINSFGKDQNKTNPVSPFRGPESRSQNEMNPKRYTSSERLVMSSNNTLMRERIGASMKQSKLYVDQENVETHMPSNHCLVEDNNSPDDDVFEEYEHDQTIVADKSDENSETSMVDSISALDISPDDVVGIIGQEHFWKARRAIINQQRVFGVQLFELHRLVNVQRLLAETPHTLIEDSSYLSKSTTKISPVKKLSADYVLAPQNRILRHTVDQEKSNKHSAETASEKTCVPLLQNVSHPPPSYSPYPSNQPPLPPMAADPNMSPWPYHQPSGHQWLVPVMSPSEGLIYKPYPGTSFMGHTHPPQVPGFHPMAPPLGYGYYPPYGMQLMTPTMLGSSVDQMNKFHVPGSTNGQPQPVSDAGANMSPHKQSSCNLTTNLSIKAHSRFLETPASKNSNAQRSTASSPSKKRVPGGRETSEVSGGWNPHPLFPTVPPAVQDGDTQSRDTPRAPRVIRVVPHNAVSATESAARIFQSIQEERKQFDSV